MRILIVRPVSTKPKRSSYNLQEEGIAKQYILLGHDCDLVYYTDGSYEKEIVSIENGKIFQVHWIPAIKIYDNSIFQRKFLEPLIKAADIVVTEEYEQIQSCLLALKYPQKVVIYHGPYDCEYKSRYKKKSQIYDIFFRKKMLRAHIQFATKSEKARRTILAKGFTNVKTIPVGLDLSKFPKIEPLEAGSNSLNFLYVGELEERRNILFLLEIIAKMKKKSFPVHLTIVGNGLESYVNMCYRRIDELQIKNEITFLGSITQADLPNIYLNHSIFLLPSRYEIFGMVLLEAMLFGRIVLTTDNGGSETLIHHGNDGFILEEDNVNEWVACLENIYFDRIDIQKISNNAREKILNNYTWKQSAFKFLSLFHEMVYK